MIACDSCDEWYHYPCINFDPESRRKSFLDKCTFYCGLNGCNEGQRIFTRHAASDCSDNCPTKEGMDNISVMENTLPTCQLDAKSRVANWICCNSQYFGSNDSSANSLSSHNAIPSFSPIVPLTHENTTSETSLHVSLQRKIETPAAQNACTEFRIVENTNSEVGSKAGGVFQIWQCTI